MRALLVYSCLLLVCLFSIDRASAQSTIRLNNGRDASIVKEVLMNDLIGSVYLYDEWKLGIVNFVGNIKPVEVPLKYDQYLDQVFYKGDGGAFYRFNDDIAEFILNSDDNITQVFRKGFPQYKKADRNSFYEVLFDGKLKFLKRTVRNIVNRAVYGGGSVNKEVQISISYYIYNPSSDTLVEVKKSEKSILNALNIKKTDIDPKVLKSFDLNDESGIVKFLKFQEEI